MRNDSNDPTQQDGDGQKGSWLGYFAACWRGEASLKDTFFASVLVYAAVFVPAVALKVGPGIRLIAVIFVMTWFSVSMWRSARQSFAHGQKFWPIIASLLALALPTATALAFVLGIMDGLAR